MRDLIALCLDDFTLKKRYCSGSIRVNIQTGRILDLIESREAADVTNWLNNFQTLH